MAKSLIKYLTYKTENCWHSVDAQFQCQADSISLSLLPIKAACTSFMNVCDQSPCRVTMMQSQTLLTHDAHFQNGAGSVLPSLLLINAAYTSFMNVCIQLPLRLPKMQNQKSLTRCWLSFSGWGRKRISLVFDYKGGKYIRKGQRYTNVNILRQAVRYLNATLNREICKPKPQIGTDG